MHTDSETTDISLLGFMPYMTVVSLEMSDEPYIGRDKIRNNKIEKAPIIIEGDAWIGCKATILPGVILKQRTIVAAGCVVNKSYNGNCILGGVPSRIIKDISQYEAESY